MLDSGFLCLLMKSLSACWNSSTFSEDYYQSELTEFIIPEFCIWEFGIKREMIDNCRGCSCPTWTGRTAWSQLVRVKVQWLKLPCRAKWELLVKHTARLEYRRWSLPIQTHNGRRIARIHAYSLRQNKTANKQIPQTKQTNNLTDKKKKSERERESESERAREKKSRNANSLTRRSTARAFAFVAIVSFLKLLSDRWPFANGLIRLFLWICLRFKKKKTKTNLST